MRLVIVTLVLVLAHVSPAAACELGEAPERLGPLLEGAAEEAHAVLGDQISGYWTNDGWDMGVAPGPLTVEQARAQIAERIAARFAPDDAEYLMSTLHLHEMPYSDAELRPLWTQLEAELTDEFGERFWWTVGIGCLDGEAWRVEVGLFDDATAEDIAAVRETLAPHGDKVRLYLGGLITPPNVGSTIKSRLRSFVRVRCVGPRRIEVRTRRSARAVIRRVTVRGRVLTGTRRVVRGRKVRVVLWVGDGTRLAHTYRYRRC